MKKRFYASIMVVAVSMAVTACGGGSQSSKNEVAEISAELEKELSAEDKAAIKEVQSELKGEGKPNTKAEPETETEAEFDPLQVDISVSGIDPYEKGLFEIFGLDNNFPKPKESFEQKWSYLTEGYGMDSQTGEIKEGIRKYVLRLKVEPQIYGDYEKEIVSYLNEKYYFENNYSFPFGDNWSGNGDTYFDNGEPSCYFEKNLLRLSFTVKDKRALEGEIIDIEYQELENGEKYPNILTIKNEDGEEIVIYLSTWAIVKLHKLEHEYASWERIPSVGDRMKFEYLCDSNYQNTNHMDGLKVKIMKIDFLD